MSPRNAPENVVQAASCQLVGPRKSRHRPAQSRRRGVAEPGGVLGVGPPALTGHPDLDQPPRGCKVGEPAVDRRPHLLLRAGQDLLRAQRPEHPQQVQDVLLVAGRALGGEALQDSKHGGIVKPGAGDRKVEDAVYTDGPFTDTTEIVSGFYLVEVDDEPFETPSPSAPQDKPDETDR